MGVLKERRYTFICAVCEEVNYCVTHRMFTRLLDEHRLKHAGKEHDYGQDAAVIVYYSAESDTDDALNAYLKWRLNFRDSET